MTCQHPNCDKTKIHRRGLCRTHYRHALISELPPCTVDGCNNNAHSPAGVCRTHYVSPNMHKQCVVDGCNNTRSAGEHCQSHYVSPNRLKQCVVDGCNKTRWQTEYCNAHYKRLRHHGTAEPPEINQRETYGYIIRDHNQTPIYIGITCNFNRRMQTHIDTQPWAPYAIIPDQPETTFPTRQQAEQWEQQTIQTLAGNGHKLFNQTHNLRWSENLENELMGIIIDIHDHKLITVGTGTAHG